jgi:hypothetical protein
VFDNCVLRIFATKRDEVAGRRKQLNDEEFHKFYSSTQIKTIELQPFKADACLIVVKDLVRTAQ